MLWVAWITLFILSCPQADFTLQTLHGPISIHLGLPVWLATALLFVLAIAFACGMASTFKYISDDFTENMGIVGMAGGLGGFLLPILFGITLDWLGINSSCFMLLYGITWVSLILLYITDVQAMPVLHSVSLSRSSAGVSRRLG